MKKYVGSMREIAKVPFREPKLEEIRKGVVKSGSVEQIKKDWE